MQLYEPTYLSQCRLAGASGAGAARQQPPCQGKGLLFLTASSFATSCGPAPRSFAFEFRAGAGGRGWALHLAASCTGGGCPPPPPSATPPSHLLCWCLLVCSSLLFLSLLVSSSSSFSFLLIVIVNGMPIPYTWPCRLRLF